MPQDREVSCFDAVNEAILAWYAPVGFLVAMPP